ncbi:MAG: NAD(P)H-quinone oxidoreductase subunit N [Kastovskya adunca ATA6-11-RM4]|nr:NAD(P)H-quinone oxidoreductase subunit N [Kastovskya adunca ATA6-11-RM4]
MPLVTTGNGFIRDLEKSGALGIYAPLEGGFEGRYQRRLRAAGYFSFSFSARSLGDPAAYLKGVHGIRPPHLGKKEIRVYYRPPIVDYYLETINPQSKGLVLWLIDGAVLSRQEGEYLVTLTQQDPRVKIVVEVGGDRFFRWTPLKDVLPGLMSAGTP